MRAFGGLINRIMEDSQMPEPQVGMGVTQCMYSDRHAFTVVELKSPNHIVVQQDKAVRTDSNGQSESQQYDYSPNPEGRKIEVTRRKNGRWVERGQPAKSTGFLIGHRDEYHDPHY